MNDQVGTPATAVAMEGPEHRIRRAQAVLDRWTARIDSGDTTGLSDPELRGLLGDAFDMANEVIKANRLLEKQALAFNVERQMSERSAERMAHELDKRVPLNELDVRHIVATEMARVMLSHVLVSENSQVVARAREMQVELGKLNSVCHELDKQRKEAIEQRDKWKADAQQWAADYLKLARMLGVPEAVRDRGVVGQAESLVSVQWESAVERLEMVVDAVLSPFDRGAGSTVSVLNLRDMLKKAFAAAKGGT